MDAPDTTPQKTRRQPGAGFVFLICGLSFLGVGIANRQTAFLTMGPTFLVLGVALMARAHKSPR
jgi:hypothetical protein